MRKYVGFLFGLAILCHPITVDANSLSLIPTEEETGIPSDIYEEAQIVGGEFCICPELLLAIAERESQFKEDATNGPCLGLMQVNAKVHEQRFVDAVGVKLIGATVTKVYMLPPVTCQSCLNSMRMLGLYSAFITERAMQSREARADS